MNVLNRKVITNDGYIATDRHGDRSIAFFAPIPNGAVVDTVKVGGRYLEDIIDAGELKYPRTEKEGELRLVAVIKDVNDAIYDEAVACMLESFEVYYHTEAIVNE